MADDDLLDGDVAALRARFGDAWDTIAPHADTIAQDPRATIRPEPAPVDTAERRALDEIGPLQREAPDGRGSRVVLEEVIGEGGTGVVHRARQISLGRQVAVKTVKPGLRGPYVVRSLVQEAWITGALEHPNVVPVYDMGLDPTGQPLIVLKRIEGVRWAELLRDEARVRRAFGVDDPFAWHLAVLMQVAGAVHFAHSRGIVHRDLKPDNVMVGAYGEVYLMDWGIAVSLRDDDERLPRAADVRELAGTPTYMAPEMVGGAAGRITERTDVYLLGAILYELVTGRPPHEGPDVVRILSSVVGEPPPLPADAPGELAAICRRAMARDPGGRYPGADAFRQALQGFLDHRESNRLAAQAERRLAELLATLEGPGDEDARLRRYKLFGECRFGFRQALAEWPENARAREGLRWAITAMVEHALDHGDVHAAETLLAELDEPAPALATRVREARRAADAEQARLTALHQDYDVSIGTRARAALAAAFAVVWTVGPLLRHWEVVPRSYLTSAAVAGLFVLIGLALVAWKREALTRTKVNRRTVGALMLGMGGLMLSDAANAWMGVPYLEGMVHHELVGALVVGMMTIAVDRRLAPAAVAYAAAVVVAARWPAEVHLVMAVVNFAFAVNLLVVWWRPTPPKARPEAPPRARS